MWVQDSGLCLHQRPDFKPWAGILRASQVEGRWFMRALFGAGELVMPLCHTFLPVFSQQVYLLWFCAFTPRSVRTQSWDKIHIAGISILSVCFLPLYRGAQALKCLSLCFSCCHSLNCVLCDLKMCIQCSSFSSRGSILCRTILCTVSSSGKNNTENLQDSSSKQMYEISGSFPKIGPSSIWTHTCSCKEIFLRHIWQAFPSVLHVMKIFCFVDLGSTVLL